MIDRPQTVQLDLRDAKFQLQLQRIATLFPQLFKEFSGLVPILIGMPWDDFEAITLPQVFEASFDGSYIVMRLHFADGKLHIAAFLADGILKLVKITKPVIHID